MTDIEKDDRTLDVQCPCGYAITIDEPRDGQSLYGTIAFEMMRHEPCEALNRASEWTFNHPQDEIEVPDI